MRFYKGEMMKKLFTMLLCLILALSSVSLYSCSKGNSGNQGGQEQTEPVDPVNHEHDLDVVWNWEETDGNGKPTAQVTCKVQGCTASAKSLKNYFDGQTKGNYYSYVYTTLDTDNLPTTENEGSGITHVYAVKRSGDTKTRYFEDSCRTVIPQITESSLVDSVIINYLSAETSKEQFSVLKRYSQTSHDKMTPYDISINVSASGATLSVYDITDGFANKTLFASTTDFSSIYYNYDYIPKHAYYWEVVQGTDVLQNGTFKFTDKVSVRYVSVHGVSNFRDLGGWTMGDGNVIPYGLIYRSGKMESISDVGRQTIKRLGIKNELDLRCLGTSTPPVDPNIDGVNYYKYYTNWQYDTFIKGNFNSAALHTSANGETGVPKGKYITTPTTYGEAYRDIFAILADRNNYPLVFNCSGGADRTGTLAFIIEGLLGVKEEDLVRDYELTSFSGSGQNRWRSNPNADGDDFNDTGVYTVGTWNAYYGLMLVEINKFEGANLSEKIENFLKTKIGVTAEQIASIKAIFGYTL